ncbi:MAG TPA: hypothetical protein VGL44_04605 [Gaiellales bacterium]
MSEPTDQTALPEGDPQSEDDAQAIVDMLIERAAEQLDAQSRTNDSLDAKAGGVLAVAVVALAGLLSIASSTPGWGSPAGLIAVGCAPLVYAIWPRAFEVGADLRTFYATMGGASRADASRQMLSQMLAAIDDNAAALPAAKAQAVRWGTALVLIGFGIAALV